MEYLECKIIDSKTFADNKVLVNINEYNIAELVLNRSNKHNALDQEMIIGLDQALEYLKRWQARVLLLKSTGKTFCAGADLNYMKTSKDFSLEENIKDAGILSDVLYSLANFHAPTIAVIQGNAYGGGVGLICCCDLALSVKQASFCLSEVKLGIIPAVISEYLINTMGLKQAKKYMLTAEVFDANKAYELNMLTDLADNHELLNNKLNNILSGLIKNSPNAMVELKNLLREYNQDLSNYRNLAINAIAEIRVSSEGQEGLAAFFEKREPYWV